MRNQALIRLTKQGRKTALKLSQQEAHLRPVGYYAGKLIQVAGLKGMREISNFRKHSGFIINLGNATACDVIQLIESKDKGKRAYWGRTIPEVRIIGED